MQQATKQQSMQIPCDELMIEKIVIMHLISSCSSHFAVSLPQNSTWSLYWLEKLFASLLNEKKNFMHVFYLYHHTVYKCSLRLQI